MATHGAPGGPTSSALYDAATDAFRRWRAGRGRCPRRPGPHDEPGALARRASDRARPRGRRGRRPEHLADPGPLRRLGPRPAGDHALAVHRRPARGLAGEQVRHPHPAGGGRGPRRTAADADLARGRGRRPTTRTRSCGRRCRACPSAASGCCGSWPGSRGPTTLRWPTPLEMPIGSIGPTRRRCLDKLRLELGGLAVTATDDELLARAGRRSTPSSTRAREISPTGCWPGWRCRTSRPSGSCSPSSSASTPASGPARGEPETSETVALEFAGTTYRVLVRVSNADDGTPPARRLGRPGPADARLPGSPGRRPRAHAAERVRRPRRPLRVPGPDAWARCGCGCCRRRAATRQSVPPFVTPAFLV